MGFGKALQRFGCAGKMHAAAGNDDRVLRRLERSDGFIEFHHIRLGTALAPDTLFEEADRVIIGFRLHVLAEGERDGAAIGRVRHGAHGAGKGCQQLLRPHDAVEITADRAEAVIHRHRAIAEIFELLQDRIGPTIGEDVAGDQQHGKAVDMGKGGGRHHVCRTRADGGGDRHGAAAAQLLRIGDGRMGHGLLVLAAIDRQFVADTIKRLADAGDIAMAENGPHAGDVGFAMFIHLRCQVTNHGLRSRQSDCLHAASPFLARASSQMRHRLV